MGGHDSHMINDALISLDFGCLTKRDTTTRLGFILTNDQLELPGLPIRLLRDF